MASRALIATLLLSLLLLGYAAESFESTSETTGRNLLQKTKDGKKKQSKGKGKTSKEKEERAEAKREAQALADFEKAQKRRDKEKEAVIKSARKEAEDEVVKFNRASDEKAQIAVFVNLWKNAKGPTILRLLTTLVSSSKSSESYFLDIVAESMLEADRKGFSFQIADGLWAGLVLVDNEEEAGPLLDVIMVNLRTKNKAKKGSGCTYVKNLFTDAEVLAIENGYEIEFTRAFDDDKYIAIAECFYDTCTKDALACCKNKKAIESGRCGCSKDEPNMCDYNLFLNTPRSIWRCNGEQCKSSKCMCPFVKEKSPKKTNAKKPKSKAKSKPKSKAKPKSKSKPKGGKPRRRESL